jgi:5-(carboxyamino)imidazole ribonucleotide mutase
MEKSHWEGMMHAAVAVVMGSESDLEVVKGTLAELDRFGIGYEVKVCSAHRTPEQAAVFSRTARERGIKVLIAAAGKAAHLPGILAAYTTLPVIGLPVRSPFMDGLDSLLSIVQMPEGVPVATVGINGSRNAALLAVQILAVNDKALSEKLSDHKKEMENKVLKTDEKLRSTLRETSQE